MQRNAPRWVSFTMPVRRANTDPQLPLVNVRFGAANQLFRLRRRVARVLTSIFKRVGRLALLAGVSASPHRLAGSLRLRHAAWWRISASPRPRKPRTTVCGGRTRTCDSLRSTHLDSCAIRSDGSSLQSRSRLEQYWAAEKQLQYNVRTAPTKGRSRNGGQKNHRSRRRDRRTGRRPGSRHSRRPERRLRLPGWGAIQNESVSACQK
jgi:hypothetical protein